MKKVLEQYGFEFSACSLSPLGNGLINDTLLLEMAGKKYVLQQVNNKVFKNPPDIGYNTRLITDHLKFSHPGYFFVAPLNTLLGSNMVECEDEFFRIFPFIEGSHTVDVVESADEAYEAAKQFAAFTKNLHGLDPELFRITIPHFHDLTLRMQQFEYAVLHGDQNRRAFCARHINYILDHRRILGEYEFHLPDLRTRIMHHDAKISNVLFNDNSKGICVIDLDTVMPGYFISDVGDMMRTYLSPVDEEEKETGRILVRKDFYEAIVDGYLEEMGEEMLESEKALFGLAGKYMIYMQAIRFLTDHLNNDTYYGAKYEGHNLVRAKNQIELLDQFMLFKHVKK